MDIAELPEEISEQIFLLLCVKDLLSCSLVSTRWREAVNKSIIWKKQCNPDINLDNVKSLVNPLFEPPRNTCELLELCKFRIEYMRQIHLKQNFRSRRFIEHDVLLPSIHPGSVECLKDILLLENIGTREFSVWDIHSIPKHLETVPFSLHHVCASVFKAIKGHLVIVQCNLLQVYKPSESGFCLKYCKLFDQLEERSNEIPSYGEITSWYSENVGLYPCDFVTLIEIVGHYFVGLVDNMLSSPAVMHVWDLESGRKLKEERLPEMEKSIGNICFGSNSDYLYILLSDYGCRIFCYDLVKCEYTKFIIESKHLIPFIFIEDEVVVMPDEEFYSPFTRCCAFHDPKTGKKISYKEFDKPVDALTMHAYDDVLVFGSVNTVIVVKLSDQQVLCMFDAGFKVKALFLVRTDLLLVDGSSVIDVWDLKAVCRLYSLPNRSLRHYDRTLTKICVQKCCDDNNINILYFW